MTEADWLTGTDFTAHVRFAVERLSARRQRLLAVGFCRAVSHLFDHPDLTEALRVVEWYADGRDTAVELEKARQQCRYLAIESHETYVRQVDATGASRGPEWARHELAWTVAFAATTPLPLVDVGSRAAEAAVQTRLGGTLFESESTEFNPAVVEQCRVMRGVVWEIVGNPFRPVEFSADWRTDTALSLARHIYESRDFGAMPILADALQDADCDNEDVLNHCRDTKVNHLRGCWVLDGVLGKE